MYCVPSLTNKSLRYPLHCLKMDRSNCLHGIIVKEKNAFWHSSAHVLAQAIIALYPQAKLTIGPAIENGFYYDVDFGDHSITEKELKYIEKKFLDFARQKFEFKMRSASKQEALDFYHKDENPYKIELIEN